MNYNRSLCPRRSRLLPRERLLSREPGRLNALACGGGDVVALAAACCFAFLAANVSLPPVINRTIVRASSVSVCFPERI